MADFSWSPIIAAVVSAGAVGVVNVLNARATAARTEGILTTTIQAFGQRLDRHETDNDRRFTEEKREREESVAKLESTDKKQWDEINSHGKDISYLKARVNGRSAHAGGD